MNGTVRGLLVQTRHNPLDGLRMALEEQSIEIYSARTCAEAALALLSNAPPHLVFTEIQLSDGNWANILTLAGKASLPVNVIVMAPNVDIGFYLHAIECGAFDFIVPPLSDPEMMHVVRIAAQNALNRRREHSADMLGPVLIPLRQDLLENEHAVAGAED